MNDSTEARKTSLLQHSSHPVVLSISKEQFNILIVTGLKFVKWFRQIVRAICILIFYLPMFNPAVQVVGHVARVKKSQDHSRAVQACISPAPRNWRRRPGRPRHIWLRAVEEDLRQFNLGFASGLRKAQNRTTWRTLTGTATSPTSSDW